ncbi:hypothetical protein [Cohnella algarum]|uniref:hypothetical protein n=1 Tax=Cohnella algarum TaxID=2044859 RepID=UPI00196780BD|nr:hypothetical protein [Cohnella algarum]MBN2980289.1 hypothetical protein [Cohnella algarum]
MDFAADEDELNYRDCLPIKIYHLVADISIKKIQEKEIRSNKQKVLLKEISFKGCRFQTFLRIPARDDVEWMLEIQLGLHTVRLTSVIENFREEEGLFVYSACWRLTSSEQQNFEYKLNEYLRTVLVSNRRILELYREISDRHG